MQQFSLCFGNVKKDCLKFIKSQETKADKFKNKEGKNELLHTLNGSSLALPRVMAGLIENNQTNDGIQVPKVLVP